MEAGTFAESPRGTGLAAVLIRTSEERMPALFTQDQVLVSETGPECLCQVGDITRTQEVRPRILVVEDDDDVRQLLGIALTSEGYAVSQAASAEEGLDRLREMPFELVLTDYALPRHSGAWMLEQALREGMVTPAAALVITAHPKPVGVDEFSVVRKPIDLDAFLDQVHAIIENRRLAGL